MTATKRGLPDFDNPPIVEAVVGVEFAPLEKWNVPHFGLYWQAIRSEYPLFEIHPPLAPSAEPQEAAQPRRSSGAVTIEAVAKPSARAWFMDSSKTRLIQVQEDRFLHNWRKVSGQEPYPHYDTSVRPTFEHEWKRFRHFLDSNDLGVPGIRLCEVTYVNHLERGREWESLGDLPQVIARWSERSSEGFLPTPDAASIFARHKMPNEQGVLYISLQPAIRNRDAKEILQFSLTARGRPASAQTADILKWLDLGREWVVRGFTDFTTSQMHHLWGRKERV